MGYLQHGGAEYEFEDRLLAHLQILIREKLLKRESFFLDWHTPSLQGNCHSAIWISIYVPLEFHYSGSREPEINRAWLLALSALAHSPRGLVVVREEAAEKYHEKNPSLR